MPLPWAMAFLAMSAELAGGALLPVGLGTRLATAPLVVILLVAALGVHWQNGWLAISDPSIWLANERVMEAAARKAQVLSILREHRNYAWLGRGPVAILNNGIEFAAMCFVMLLSLFCTGLGRFTSVDYLLARWFGKKASEQAGE